MKMPPRRVLLLALNLIAFQLAWFASILGAAHGQPNWGIAAVAVAVALQFIVSDARISDAVLLGAALAVGLVWDTAMTRTGLVEYASPGPIAGWAPGWILALWALFATILREPLRWLHGRWMLAALMGGASGAMSYWGAVRLGGGRFPDFELAMTVLAVGWAVITPALTQLARWLNSRR
ncbi:DUF2878 domain-containing protein [Paucibacter sp. R3-3]|uniref:DUF2878 domain-containing protein n=1 Tax=Roseateles agri TaxID=3098619 RepID=A0ABU5DBP7_9BURK|nr:DUF2878 domain-containing protein [Paucibacter sp. R3-3]MDY0743692.1 DUF2878 domain-containing protein [Paucibacter sp. R3-3]